MCTSPPSGTDPRPPPPQTTHLVFVFTYLQSTYATKSTPGRGDAAVFRAGQHAAGVDARRGGAATGHGHLPRRAPQPRRRCGSGRLWAPASSHHQGATGLAPWAAPDAPATSLKAVCSPLTPANPTLWAPPGHLLHLPYTTSAPAMSPITPPPRPGPVGGEHGAHGGLPGRPQQADRRARAVGATCWGVGGGAGRGAQGASSPLLA